MAPSATSFADKVAWTWSKFVVRTQFSLCEDMNIFYKHKISLIFSELSVILDLSGNGGYCAIFVSAHIVDTETTFAICRTYHKKQPSQAFLLYYKV